MATLFVTLFPPSGWRIDLPRHLVLILALFMTGGAAMADIPNRQHYLDFDVQGASWVLRLNGVDLWSRGSTGLCSSSLPVNDLVKKGENTVSLVHVPTRKLDPETGVFVLEHHDHFGAEIRLQAIAREGRREEITMKQATCLQ